MGDSERGRSVRAYRDLRGERAYRDRRGTEGGCAERFAQGVPSGLWNGAPMGPCAWTTRDVCGGLLVRVVLGQPETGLKARAMQT